MISALLLPVIFMATGLLIDLVRWGYYHNSLVQAVNTAALSTSVQLLKSVEDKSKKKALSSPEKENVKQYLLNNLKISLYNDFGEMDSQRIIQHTKVNIYNRKSTYIINVYSHYNLPLNPFSLLYMNFINIKSWPITTIGETEVRIKDNYHKEEGVSIQWLIDDSGSMSSPHLMKYGEVSPCLDSNQLKSKYNVGSKIGIVRNKNAKTKTSNHPGWRGDEVVSCDRSLYYVLNDKKILGGDDLEEKDLYDYIHNDRKHYISKRYLVRDALATFISRVNKIDNLQDKLRMSFIYFNHRIDHYFPMTWGIKDFTQEVSSHYKKEHKDQGTDIHPALQKAYNTLRSKNEDDEHKKKDSVEVKKIIVLLTDGAQQEDRHSVDSLIKICDAAKAEGITIFTIGYSVVFYEIKKANDFLSRCASPGKFFEVYDVDKLNMIFKKHIGGAIFERLVKIRR
ncbi:vWA domain-containing protein [Candidatus Liberibacter solanacearum]